MNINRKTDVENQYSNFLNKENKCYNHVRPVSPTRTYKYKDITHESCMYICIIMLKNIIHISANLHFNLK